MRLVTGIIFVVSAIAKLFSLESFELYIFSMGIIGFDLSSLVARLVISMELIVGIFLMVNIFRKETISFTFAMLAAFSGFLVWRMALGDEESCHCFGDIVDLNPAQSLIKNIILALLLVYCWEGGINRYLLAWINERRWWIGPAVAVVALALPLSINPPDLFYRGSHVSQDLVPERFLPVAEREHLTEGRRVVCFYSCSCPHCMHCARKMSGIISRNDLPEDSVSVIFMTTSAQQDSLVSEFFNANAGGQVLPYTNLHPYDFIPLTNGSMPLVVTMKNGEIVKEYDYLSLSEKELCEFFGK